MKKKIGLFISVMVLLLCTILPIGILRSTADQPTTQATGNEAKIGDIEYATLSEALTAAQDGNTVTMLTDFTTGRLAITKEITFDLGGKILTFDGSANTIFIGVGGTATIDNGTIRSNTDLSLGTVFVLNGDLTLGNRLTIENTASGNAIYSHANNDSTNRVTVNGATVIAHSDIAVGQYGGGAKTIVINGGQISGKVVNSSTTDAATINGGAFSIDPDTFTNVTVASTPKNIDNLYYVGEAKVGTVGYATLERAYASLVGDGATIELLGDVTLEKTMSTNKTYVLKSFGDDTFKISAAADFSGAHLFETDYGHDGYIKTPHFQNLEFVGKSGVRHVYVAYGRNANFTNVKFTNGNAGNGGSLYIAGRVNLNSCVFENNTATNGADIYVCKENGNRTAVVNVNACAMKLGNVENSIYISDATSVVNVNEGTEIVATKYAIINNGSLTVNGGTIRGMGNAAAYYGVAIANYGTVTVNGGAIEGERHGIVNTDKVYVKGGTVEGTGNEGISNGSAADRIAMVEISGGTVKGAYAVCDYSEYDEANYPEYLNKITGGTLENTSANISTIGVYDGNGGTWSITGGRFKHASGNSANILDAKVKWREEAAYVWVNEAGDTGYHTLALAAAKIGNTKYVSLREAVSAAKDNDTITLLADIDVYEESTNHTSLTITGKVITIDLAGFNITSSGSYSRDTLLDVNLNSGNEAYVTLTNSSDKQSVIGSDKVSTAISATQTGSLVIDDNILVKAKYPLIVNSATSFECTVKGALESTLQSADGTSILGALTVSQSGVTVNIEETAVITGDVAIGVVTAPNVININGGTITGALHIADEYANITGGTFSVDPTTIEGLTINAQAKITDEYTVIYDTLVNALIAVEDGQTIDILNDIDVSAEYGMWDKSFTIDGNGHTLKRAAGNSDNLLAVTSGSVTVENIVIDGGAVWSGDNPATRVNGGLTATCTNRYNGQLVFVGGSGEFILGNGAILQNNLRTGSAEAVSDGGSAVVTNGSGIFTMLDGSTIQNCTVYNTASADGSEGGDGAAISLWDSSIANIEGGVITGCFAPRMGGAIRVASASATLRINGGTISGNYTKAKSFGNLALKGHNIIINGSPVIEDNWAVPHYEADGYHVGEKVQSQIVFYDGGSIRTETGISVDKPIMVSCTDSNVVMDELTGEYSVNRVAGTIMTGGAQYADMFTTSIDGYMVYVDGNNLVTKAISGTVLYVDGVNGSNTNTGDRNHPLKSLEQAFLKLANAGQSGTIVLLTDVTHDGYVNNNKIEGQSVTVVSEGNAKTVNEANPSTNTDWHLLENTNFTLILDHVIFDGSRGTNSGYGIFFVAESCTLTLRNGTVLQNFTNRAVNVRPGGVLNIYEGCSIIDNIAGANNLYRWDGADGVENVGGAVYVCAGGKLQLCVETTGNYTRGDIRIEGNKDSAGKSTGIYLESGSYMNTAAANAHIADQIYVNPYKTNDLLGEVYTTLLFHVNQRFDDVYLADGASIGKNGTQAQPVVITMENLLQTTEAVHVYSGGTEDITMFSGKNFALKLENGNYVADVVAEVNGVYYGSLADAVAAANAGDTVTLLKDITLTAQIEITKNVTVNLGGHTVSRDSAGVKLFSVNANATLTLQNGTLDGKNVSSAAGDDTTTTNWNLVFVNEYGNFTANGVTFQNAVTRWGAIISFSNTRVELTDCQIINNSASDELRANGSALHIYAYIKLTNCTITGNVEKLDGSSAIHLKTTAIVELCGTNYIYDNLYNGKQTNIKSAANNQISVSGSVVGSKIGVTSGSFTPIASGNGYTLTLADAATFIDDAGVKAATTSANTVVWTTPVATVNGVHYANLQDAVDALSDGETLVLLGNATLNSTLTIDKNITITSAEGQNYKIIRAEGFDGDDLIAVESNGALTLRDVTVDGNGVEIAKEGVNLIDVNGGSLTIEDGALITGHNDTTTSGNVKGTIFAHGGGTVTMNGGEISGNKALYGSAVTVYNTSGSDVNTFTMNGGSITDNEATGRENATVAGAVQVGEKGSTFTMTGGEITDNTSVNGYGAGVTVMNGGIMNVEGSSTVFDNKTDGEQNNVYLIDGATLNVSGALENNVGVTAANGAPTIGTTDGYTLTEADAFKLVEDTGVYAPVYQNGGVTYGTAVAEVVESGVRYTTLAAAVTAASEGDTIKILCDVTLPAEIAITKSLTIDLGGYTVKRGTNTGALFEVTAVGTFTVKNGTLDGDKATYSAGNTSRQALVNTTTAVIFYAENVTFRDNYGRYGGALFMGTAAGASAHLTDCTVTGNQAYDCGGAFHLYVPLYLNNCTITDNWDNRTSDTLGGNGYAFHMKDGYAVYLSGKIVVKDNTRGSDDQPANVLVYSTTPVYVEGALAKGSYIGVKLSNGVSVIASGTDTYTITNDDAICFVDDTGAKAAVKSENTVVWTTPAATVNGVNYADVQSAIDAIPDGVTAELVLRADVTGTLTIPENKKVILDLNGFDVNAGGGTAIVNNGTLTVRGEGNVTGGYGIQNNSVLTVESGTIIGTGYDGIFNEPEATSVTVTGGTIKGNNLAICDYATNGTVTISGGVLECTGTNSSAGTGWVVGSYGSNVGGTWTIATDGSVQLINANYPTQLINGVDAEASAGNAQIKVNDLYQTVFTEGEDGYFTVTSADNVVSGEAEDFMAAVGANTVLTPEAKEALSAEAEEIVDKYASLIAAATSTEAVSEYIEAAKAELNALFGFLTPANVYVSENGDDNNFGTLDSPVATLDHALALVQSGGTVYVMTDLTLTNYNLIDKDVTIRSYGGQHTLTAAITEADGRLNQSVNINTSSRNTAVVRNHFVIGAVNGGNVAVAGTAVTVRIENFIFTGGMGYGESGNAFGGSIYVFKGSTLYLTDCTFTENQAGYMYYSGYAYSGYGGAIFNDGTLYMTDCLVDGNLADYSHNKGAGGIHNNNDSVAYLTGVTVRNNTAQSSSASTVGPGGIYGSSSVTLYLDDVTVTNNASNGSGNGSIGGGVALYISAKLYLSGTIVIKDNTVSGSVKGGDLVFWRSSDKMAAVVLNETFEETSDIGVSIVNSSGSTYNYYTADVVIASAAEGVTLTRDMAEAFHSTTHIGLLVDNTVQFTNKNNVTYDVVYVSASRGDDANLGYLSEKPVQTFATAVQRVKAGGVIYVMDDLTVTAKITMNKSCTVAKWSEAEGEPSIVRASTLTSGDMIVVAADVTFKSLIFDGNEVNAGNGALIAFSTADKTLTLEGCTLRNAKRTTSYGGALYQTNGTVNITGCSFESNESPYGGAIYVSGTTATLYIVGSRFEGNKATTYYGGAIYVLSAKTLQVENTYFVGNTATSNGGAVNQGGAAASSFTGCSFDGNSSNGYGGAIYCSAGTMTLRATDFVDNVGKYAGAFYQTYSVTSTFIDCDFEGNKATDSGAAYGAAMKLDNGTAYVQGGCISGNEGSNAIYVGTNAKLYLSDNVEISGNTITNSNGGAVKLDGTGSMLYVEGVVVIADNYYAETSSSADLTVAYASRIQITDCVENAEIWVNYIGTTAEDTVLATCDAAYSVTEDDLKAFTLTKSTDRVLKIKNNKIVFAAPTAAITGVEHIYSYAEGNAVTAVFEFTTDGPVVNYNAKIDDKTGTVIGAYAGDSYVVKFTGLTASATYSVQGIDNKGVASGEALSWTAPTATQASGSGYWSAVGSGAHTGADGLVNDGISYSIKSNGNIDIHGFGGVKTTYGNAGWTIVNNNGGITVWAVPTIVKGASGADYVQITYYIRNNTNSDKTGIKLGAHADIMIGSNDRAPIYLEDYGIRTAVGAWEDALSFAVITQKGEGIAQYASGADSRWFGAYSQRYSNVFTNVNKNSLTNTDSGAAFSWQGLELAAGEIIQVSVVIGVAGNEEVQNDVTPPTGGFDQGIDQSEDAEIVPAEKSEAPAGDGVSTAFDSVTLPVTAGKTYYVKDAEGNVVQTFEATEDGSYTFSGLAAGTEYTVTVKEADKEESDGLTVTTAAPPAEADKVTGSFTLGEYQRVEGGYSFPNATATISSGNFSNLSVMVDSGSFTFNQLPTLTGSVSALTADGRYVTSLTAGEAYCYVIFNQSFTQTEADALLRSAIFVTAGVGTTQKITVDSDVAALPAGVVRMGDSYYRYVVFPGISWDAAYAAAKQSYVNGLQGYLMTIENAFEHQFIYQAFGGVNGWMGGLRTDNGAFDENTFNPTKGSTWVWVCGPSAGSEIYNVYANWHSGEPNNYANGEWAAQYGYGAGGKWNDLSTTNSAIGGYFIEYTLYGSQSVYNPLAHGEATIFEGMDTVEELQKAIDNAADGEVIKLDGDIFGQITIPKDKNITIDLNGHTIAGNKGAIMNGGTLNVVDSSEDKTGKIVGIGQSGSAIVNNAGATLNITGVNGIYGGAASADDYTNLTGSNSSGIYMYGGTLTVTDSTVKGCNYGIYVGDGELTVTETDSGETVVGGVSNGAVGIYVSKNSSADISGGDISGTTLGIQNDGALTVSGENTTVYGYSNGICNGSTSNSNAQLTVEGGTITGVNYGIATWGDAEINGGSVTGAIGVGAAGDITLTVNGGVITGTGEAAIKNAATTVLNGGTLHGDGTKTDGVVNEGNLVVNDGVVITAARDGIHQADNAAKNNTPVTTVNGGTITGTNCAIFDDSTRGEGTVAGGILTNSNGNDGYTVEVRNDGWTIAPESDIVLTETTGGEHYMQGEFAGDYLLVGGDVANSNKLISTTREVETLDELNWAIANGVTNIVLTGDIAGDVTIPTNSNVTIDLNGYTIAGTVTNNGTLTVEDSSDGNTGTIQGATGIVNNGTAYVRGGNVIGDSSHAIESTGTLYVSGDANISGEARGIYNNGGTLTVDGDEVVVYGNTGSAVTTFNGGTTTLNGGSYDSTKYAAVSNQDSTTLITGGTYHGAYATTITGGSFTGNVSVSDGISNAFVDGTLIWTSEEPNVSDVTFGENATLENKDYVIDGDTVKRVSITVGTVEELKAAIEAGITNITLTANITTTETIVVPEEANVTLNLGAFTITNTSTNVSEVIENYGTLTVNGGTLSNSSAENAITNHGNMVLENVTVQGGYHGVSNVPADGQPTPSLTINGGNITGAYSAVWNGGNAEITGNGVLTGGTSAIANRENATLEISGEPTVTGNNGNAVYNAGSATINGGTYIGTGTYASVYEDKDGNATTVINGGTYNQTAIADTVTGGTFKALTVSESVSNATVNNKLTWTSETPDVSSVTFGENATLGNDGYKIDGNTVKRLQITVNSLEELKAAIENAKPGDVIVLGGEIEGDITIPASENIVLELNGHKINGTVINEGTLTVKDSAGGGEIVGGNAEGIVSSGTLTVESGKISGSIAVKVEGGTAEIKGGTINGSEYGVYVAKDATATVSGGEIIGGKYGIGNDGTVTVGGENTTVTGTVNGIANGSKNNVDAQLTVTGGTISGTNSTNGYGIASWGDSEITGGSITGGFVGLGVQSDATVTVGGTVEITGRTQGINTTGHVEITGDAVIKGTENNGIYNYDGGELTVTGNASVEGAQNAVCNHATATLNNGTYTGNGTYASVYDDGTTEINGGTYNQTAIADRVTGGTFNALTVSESVSNATVNDKLTWTSEEPNVSSVTFGKNATLGNEDYEIYGNTVKLVSITVDTLAELQAAIDSNPNVPIKLGGDIVGSITIPTNSDIILDLNGHSLTTADAHTVQVQANAKLTVTDSSPEHTGKIETTSADGVHHAIQNRGDVVVESGTIIGSKSGINLPSGSNGTVVVNGGTVQGTSGSGIINDSDYDGVALTVNGGTVIGNTSGIYNWDSKVQTVINGGTVSATTGAGVDNNGGELTVNGGAVSGSTAGILNNGTTVICGGTVSGTGSYGDGVQNYGSLTVKDDAEINAVRNGIWQTGNNAPDTTVSGGSITGVNCGIYDSTANGTGTITGGSFTTSHGGNGYALHDVYPNTGWTVAPEDEIVLTDTSGTGSYITGSFAGDYALVNGDTNSVVLTRDIVEVDTLEKLQEAIANGATNIVLTGDIAGDVSIPTNSNVTIDLNGHTIAGTVTNNGTLTVKDTDGTGEIVGGDGVGILSAGDLFVESGKVSGSTAIQVQSGTATVTGGNIVGSTDGIVIESGASASVLGGTVTGSHATDDGKGAGSAITNGGSLTVGGNAQVTAAHNNGVVNDGDLLVESNAQISGKWDGISNTGENATITMTGGTVSGGTFAICDYATNSQNVLSGGTLINTDNGVGDEGHYVLGSYGDGVGGTWTIANNGNVQFKTDTEGTNFIDGVDGDGTATGGQVKVENLDGLGFTATTDGFYKVEGTIETDILSYINLSLNGAIGVNLYFHLPEGYLDGTYRLAYKVANGEMKYIAVSDTLPKDQGTWIFSIPVEAKQMTDAITFWFEKNGVSGSKVRTTTVAEYAYYILRADLATLDCGLNQSVYLKALMASMLNYGADAQTYFGYHTDDLANARLGEYTNDNGDSFADYFAELNGDMFTEDNAYYQASGEFFASTSASGEGVVGIDLGLQSTTSMNIKFRVAKGASIADYKFTITHTELFENGNYYNLSEYAYASAAESDERYDYYYVCIQNIPAAYIDQTFEMVIQRSGTKVATFQIMATWYIKQIVEASTDERAIDIVTGLYWYNYYANLYFKY